MMPLSPDELTSMKATQQAAMMDTGQFLRYSETYDAMHHPVPAWTAGTVTECGVEMTGGDEIKGQRVRSDATFLVYDAKLRLPLGSVLDPRDRFVILARYGQACAPIIYDFVGPALEGPSGIVIKLKASDQSYDPYLYRRTDVELGYYQVLSGLFGANMVDYWPLYETSGASAIDLAGGNAGVYSGAALANASGANLNMAPRFSGAGGVDILSAVGDINTAEGSVLMWIKVNDIALWGDANTYTLLDLFADGANYIRIQKDQGTPNQLSFYYVAGGVLRQVNTPNFYPSGWVCVAFLWSKAAGAIQAYLNGELLGTTTAIGTFAGTLTRAVIASRGTANYWNGWASDIAILNRPATASEMRSAARGSTGTTLIVYSRVGDSLGAKVSTARYPERIQSGYNGGSVALVNHAVGGASVMANLDGQVAASANDDADIFVIEMGGNDNNAGDMTALQAKIESNIIAIRASNPRATVYYQNVTPAWTDVTGAVEIIKNNVRAAILAACNAQGVPCWDPYTVPWIVASDTLDGMHLTVGGGAKVAAQVLARLA